MMSYENLEKLLYEIGKSLRFWNCRLR